MHVGFEATESLLGECARTESPPGYSRAPVPADKVSWETQFEAYAPHAYTALVVLENDHTLKAGGWADELDPRKAFARRTPRSLTGRPIRFDELGRPLNPAGRTGTAGRGLLGKWGPNLAADPIVTRLNPLSGELEMLAILRKDRRQWAIPGGMVDEGEDVSTTLAREFSEEAGVVLDMTDARLVYAGYVDDPRNTDHAWIETTVKHKHLDPETARRVEPTAGDDAAAVRWLPLTEEHVSHLYASHGEFVRRVLQALRK
jgi:ADP-ribose pyrophosphatase